MLSVLLPICLMFLLIGAPVWAVGLLTFPAIIGLIKILFGINKKNGDAKKAKEANKPKKKEGEEDEDDEDDEDEEEEELDENGQPIPKAPKRPKAPGGPDAPDAPDAPEAPEAPGMPGMPGMPGRERKLGRDGFRVLGILGDRELRNFKRVLRDKRNRKLFFREKKRIYEFFRVNGIVLEKGRKRKGVRKLTVRYLKDYHPGFKGTEVFVDKVLNILFFNKKRIFNFIGHQ